MTAITKNIYTDKLNDIANKYNIYYRAITMKPIDAQSNTYIDFDVENNNKDLKFKVGDQVTISKFENIFAKRYTAYSSKEFFFIK